MDGNRCPTLPYPTRAIVKGDAREPSISAASILAKTVRDEAMRVLDREWPQHGLAGHKGYPTAAHLMAIERHGVAPFYRRSFRAGAAPGRARGRRRRMKTISSRDNPLVKRLHALASSGRERRKLGETLLDGAHLVQAALSVRAA